jgi:high-affinity Fe2+/Pb2+ permease
VTLLRLAPLAAAAVFLLGGSIALAVEDNGLAGTTLLAAGLITLGAWLALESWRQVDEWQRRKPRPRQEDDR